MNNKRIFLSYCHSDGYADIIDDYFQKVGVKLIRDSRNLTYAENILDFAKYTRRASYTVALISDSFLKSEYCMFEMLILYKDSNFDKKICPVLLNKNNSEMLNPTAINEYTNYWLEKYKEQDKLVNDIVDNRLKGAQIEQLNIYYDLVRLVPKFLYHIRNNVYLPQGEIDKNGIEAFDKHILNKIGISPNISIDELYRITELKTLEEAERAFFEYSTNNLVKENEYFNFTKATVYEKFNMYDLALYNYKLAYKHNTKFTSAYEAIIVMYIKEIFKFDIEYEITAKLLGEIDRKNVLLKLAKAMTILRSNSDSLEGVEKAIEIFEELTIVELPYKQSAYLYNSLGNAYQYKYKICKQQKSINLSENYFNEAIKINSSYFQAYNNLALLYLICFNDHVRAKVAIQQALEINPNYHHALNTMGLIAEAINDYNTALEYYFKAYDTSKNFYSPINNIGRILDYEMSNELCGYYYSMVYSKNPNSLTYCFNYGNYFRKYTEYTDKAYDLLNNAYEMSPENILCNMACGLYYVGLEEYNHALNYFYFCFKKDDNYLPAIVCCILCKYMLGKNRNETIRLLKQLNYLHSQSIIEYIECNSELPNRKMIKVFLIELEREYVNIEDQYNKALVLNPLINKTEVYQYLKDNFFEMQSKVYNEEKNE